MGSGRARRASRWGVAGVVLGMGLAVGMPGVSAAASPSAWTAHGSAEQVYVLGFPRGDTAELVNADGHVVPTPNTDDQTVTRLTPDSLGGVLFRHVPPGRWLPQGRRAGATASVLADKKITLDRRTLSEPGTPIGFVGHPADQHRIRNHTG